MNDTKAKGFEWLRVWAFKESDWRDEIQNLMFWDFPFILVCKNTRGVCARGGIGRLSTSMHIPRLTCEHEIPEIRELVHDSNRHLET